MANCKATYLPDDSRNSSPLPAVARTDTAVKRMVVRNLKGILN
jgi:hypothetical protein